MIPEPDPGVVAAARRGDPSAFRVLVEGLMPATWAIARRMTGRHADAEDLVQEVFLRLYRFLDRYNEARPFAPWYRSMTVRAGLNFLRGTPRDRRLPDDAPAPAAPESPDVERLDRAIAELPPNYRAAVTLHYLEGQDLAEISEILDAPVGTIKTWLHRARETLRHSLA